MLLDEKVLQFSQWMLCTDAVKFKHDIPSTCSVRVAFEEVDAFQELNVYCSVCVVRLLNKMEFC